MLGSSGVRRSGRAAYASRCESNNRFSFSFMFAAEPSREQQKTKAVKTLSEGFMLDILFVGLIILFFSIAIGYVHFVDRLKGKTVQRRND
jgi:hypothetical protein